jgi:hypothetical protein
MLRKQRADTNSDLRHTCLYTAYALYDNSRRISQSIKLLLRDYGCVTAIR